MYSGIEAKTSEGCPTAEWVCSCKSWLVLHEYTVDMLIFEFKGWVVQCRGTVVIQSFILCIAIVIPTEHLSDNKE